MKAAAAAFRKPPAKTIDQLLGSDDGGGPTSLVKLLKGINCSLTHDRFGGDAERLKARSQIILPPGPRGILSPVRSYFYPHMLPAIAEWHHHHSRDQIDR